MAEVKAPPRALSNRRFNQFIFAGLGAGFVALLVMVGGVVWLVNRDIAFNRLVDHTYQVETSISEFRVLFERAEAGRRGYLLTGESVYRGVYFDAVRQLEPALGKMRELTRDNPAQQDRIARMEPLLKTELANLAASVERARGGDLEGARAMFIVELNGQIMDGLRSLSAEMTAEENRLLAGRNAEQVANARALLISVIGSAALLMLVALISLALMRRYARDLMISQEELRKLNEGLESAVKERTADLIRANEEIQRFAYIVSHDLRSPLVNVMGFTTELELSIEPLRTMVRAAEEKAPEILSQPAKTAVETDLPEAIGFIRASTQKMDRLIAAILQLSRQGRRTLRPERLSVGQLVVASSEAIRHQLTDKGAEVVIEGDLPEIVSDRLAIEQIFSNLIENGVKYLKPGVPGRVVVRGREELGGRVVYEVQDNGRGIDPKDHERIFELFRRSGVQDRPGEGIGLANVRALAYRLGGTVTCESELDQGATFRLSLPRSLVQAQEIAA